MNSPLLSKILFLSGFGLTVRNETRNQILGIFGDDPNVKFLNCGLRFKSMAFNANDDPKTKVTLTWERPNDLPKGMSVIVTAALVKGPNERYLLKKTIKPW